MPTLLFSGTKLGQCICPSGKNTRFLDTSDYILQVVLTECKDVGLHETRQFEKSVCLERSDQYLLAKCIELEFDADVAHCLLALRLLQSDKGKGRHGATRRGATRCIGTIDVGCLSKWATGGPTDRAHAGVDCAPGGATNRVPAEIARGRHPVAGRFTQVTDQPVAYSWQAERLQIADLVVANCQVVGACKASRASLMWETGPVETASLLNGLQHLEKHAYTTSFLTCKKGFRYPLAPSNKVVMPNLYQFTVPEIDGVPLADAERHIASYNNRSIPPSCIEDMLTFTRHIVPIGGQVRPHLPHPLCVA